MITESLARALSLEELADRLADDHDDPIVRNFFRRMTDEGLIRDNDRIDELESEVQEAESSAEHWQSEAEENEQALEKLTKRVREAIVKQTDRDALAKELEELL